MSRECKRCGENHEERDLINKAVDDHFWELFDDETEGTGETSPPKPSEPIELERLDELMKTVGKKIVQGIAISIARDEVYDTQPLEDWLKEQTLEWMKSLVLDNVIGADDLDNYRLAHYECNNLKGSLEPDEFRAFQIGQIQWEDQ